MKRLAPNRLSIVLPSHALELTEFFQCSLPRLTYLGVRISLILSEELEEPEFLVGRQILQRPRGRLV